jgi:16S rRNA processing protein RimM
LIDDYISIGKITSTFGLKGFLKVASSGDILPSLKANSTLYLSSESSFKPCRLLEIRKVKNQYVLSIEGCKSIEEAEKLIGSILYFPKKSSKELLGVDEFFVHQLIGLHPYLGDTEYTGFKLTEVIENPVHPVLLFSDTNIEILIPYINKFIGKVDLENSRIEILNWQDWINAD